MLAGSTGTCVTCGITDVIGLNHGNIKRLQIN